MIELLIDKNFVAKLPKTLQFNNQNKNSQNAGFKLKLKKTNMFTPPSLVKSQVKIQT